MSDQRRFLAVGHLYERTTKTGDPYLTGIIAGQQVFLFPQADGSWTVFTPVEEPSASVRRTPPDPLADQREYEKTLAGIEVPEYDEPLRRSVPRERPSSPSAARRS